MHLYSVDYSNVLEIEYFNFYAIVIHTEKAISLCVSIQNTSNDFYS